MPDRKKHDAGPEARPHAYRRDEDGEPILPGFFDDRCSGVVLLPVEPPRDPGPGGDTPYNKDE